MERYCRNCKIEVESVFCPNCKKFTKIIYDKYKLPSTNSIYSNTKGISKNASIYNRRFGSGPNFRNTKEKLNQGYYKCSNCSYWCDDWCSHKGCKSSEDALCENYEEQIL